MLSAGPACMVGVGVPTDAIADGDIGDHLLLMVGCALVAQRCEQARNLQAETALRMTDEKAGWLRPRVS